MSIQHVSSKAESKIHNTQTTLRPGQIIQGKILKLFPNNKAQIQLGSQQMIAQLEASLTTGEKYHFQVQATGDVLRLKVLGEQLKNQMSDNVMNLMQQLGLKATKPISALVKLLMNEKIPFDKEQIIKAFELLDGSKNKVKALQVVRDMIAHKLPITDSIFQALYTKSTSGLSEQMNALLLQLKKDTNHTPLQQNLIGRLGLISERSLSSKGVFIKQIISEVNSNNSQFFNLLKTAGAVDSTVDFSSWKEQWGNFAKSNNINASQQVSTLKLPFQLNHATSQQMLGQMSNHKIGNETQVLMQQWSKTIGHALQNASPLSAQDFSSVKLQIEQTLLPILSSNQQQQITKLLQNNPVQLRQLLSLIQTLADDQSYKQVEQFLTNAKQSESLLFTNPKDQFLAQLKQVLNFTGLSYENQLINEQQQTSTVKSMLIQLLQQSDGVLHERSQQLLHFINGMQIHSVNDSTNFIQASLQLPGEKLGLNSDLQLDFESNKTESGEINPDFCRILFYLNLANLNETVIDMNIQKRTVSVTIFNDHEDISDKSMTLKPMLKAGLQDLDYNLSNVTFRPLQQMDKPKQDTQIQSNNFSIQGVDYRV